MIDLVSATYDTDQLVTMVYAVLDPGADRMVLANAGHHAPIIVRSDGLPEMVLLPEDVLLGGGGCQRRSVEVPFTVGDSLLAFTDGLVERRNESIDSGLRRVREASVRLDPVDLSRSLDDLVAHVSDPGRDDDVAALIVHRTT